MDWHEAVADGLPTDPSPGTPELRNDILDELSDHLACAFQREMRRTDDETTAREAVIERFGDPRSIARQLWWDAVKERVMRDRILLVSVACAMLASIGASVVVYQAMVQGREANEAMMSKMLELSTKQGGTGIVEGWSHLNLSVLYDRPGRPPAENVHVTVTGKLFNNSDDSLGSKTDSNGAARFGPIRPGVVKVKVTTDAYSMNGEKQYVLYPGTSRDVTIMCPEAELRTGKVRAAFEWPGEISGDDVLLQLELDDSYREVDGWNWYRPGNVSFFVDTKGRALTCEKKEHNGFFVWVETKPRTDSFELPVGRYAFQTVVPCVSSPIEDSGGFWTESGARISQRSTLEVKDGSETKMDIKLSEELGKSLDYVRRELNEQLSRWSKTAHE